MNDLNNEAMISSYVNKLKADTSQKNPEYFFNDDSEEEHENKGKGLPESRTNVFNMNAFNSTTKYQMDKQQESKSTLDKTSTIDQPQSVEHLGIGSGFSFFKNIASNI